MSMVVCTVTKEFLLMSSDSRGVDEEKDIVLSDIKKIYKPNDNVLVGFTGDYKVPEILGKNGFFNMPGIFADEYAEYLLRSLIGENGNIVSNIIVAGKGKENHIYISFFHAGDTTMQMSEYVPDKKTITIPLTPPTIDFAKVFHKINREVSEIIDLTINNLKVIHKQNIVEVAKIDTSVDENIVYFAIKV